jgi:hypothetical protein
MKVVIITLTTLAIGLAAQAQEHGSTNMNTNPALTTPSGGYNNSSDHPGQSGVGAKFGEPIGADAKYWFNEKMAIDGAIGYSFHENTDLYLPSDILLHAFHPFPVSQDQLPFHLGVGGLARYWTDDNPNGVGFRVPVAISYMFEKLPLGILMEVTPPFDIASRVRSDVTGGIGVRYWF